MLSLKDFIVLEECYKDTEDKDYEPVFDFSYCEKEDDEDIKEAKVIIQ